MGTHIFNSPYNQHDRLNGQECTIVETINVPSLTHDEEVLPMYRIVMDDGEAIEAWPEELHPKVPSMRALNRALATIAGRITKADAEGKDPDPWDLLALKSTASLIIDRLKEEEHE